MKWMYKLLMAVAFGLALGNTGQAGYFFEFEHSNYLVNPGESVLVQLFIVQTAPDDLLSTEGLFSGFTQVTYNESPFASDPAQVGSAADITPNPLFNFTAGLSVVHATSSAAGTASAPYGALIPVVAAVDRILLGGYKFTAGSVAGEVTSLRASILDPSQANFVTGVSFTVLDSFIVDGSSKITVNGSGPPPTVPEPASMAMLGIGLSVAILYARRGRKLATA
jgi:PEP-CTERM motif